MAISGHNSALGQVGEIMGHFIETLLAGNLTKQHDLNSVLIRQGTMLLLALSNHWRLSINTVHSRLLGPFNFLVVLLVKFEIFRLINVILSCS